MGRVRRIFTAISLVCLAGLAGCATTGPSSVSGIVGTTGSMDPNVAGYQFAWAMDDQQRSNPVILAVVDAATAHFQEKGMIEAPDAAMADFLVALNTRVELQGEQTISYNVQRYVPGPSRSYEREVEVYDTYGSYVGTRREVVTEREPGRYVTERRQATTDLYQRLIEFSFISAEDFRNGGAEPLYTIGAQSNGSSDGLGPVGGCMIDMIFEVFPKSITQPRVSRIAEQHVGQCDLPES